MPNDAPALVRSIGLFDFTMIVMGGIIGSGIFMNPSVVARQVQTPHLILSVWFLGGLIALIAAFIYAELAERRPYVGGQYAYLRDAYHPLAGFLYGWTLLLVIQTGGMAAVALTFARYFLELFPITSPEWLVAAIVLLLLTIINCLGVRAGSLLQSALMIIKIVAILSLIAAGLFGDSQPQNIVRPVEPLSLGLFSVIGAGMVPVLFAYGGWQTAGFVSGEVRRPQRTIPKGLLLGITGVVLLYTSVNYVAIKVLGSEGLAATSAPASAIMTNTLGSSGAKIIAAGIAVSTLGFLSQSMLTAPRVYYAMAQDGLFFETMARIHPKTRVPIFAIVLQGMCALVIALSGRYEQILNYVVSADFIFFGLTAAAIFVFRKQDRKATLVKIPGHPFSTIFFISVSWLVVLNTLYRYPTNSLIGVVLILAGIPAYFLWSRKKPYSTESTKS